MSFCFYVYVVHYAYALCTLQNKNFISLISYLKNIEKGKSAGYRLIYLLESEISILLLTIYSKSEQEDITVNEINSILNECFEEE